jgi:hypothetical protein
MNQLTLNHNALASNDLEPLDHLYQLHAFTEAAYLDITGSNFAIQTDEPREADILGVGAHPFTPTSLRKSYVLHTVAKWAKGA